MVDVQKMADAVFASVKGYLASALAPFEGRIKALEEREPEVVTVKGEDGKSVTLHDVAPIIAEEVEKAVSHIPAPKDGEHGDPETLLPQIKQWFDDALQGIKSEIELIPAPQDGKSVSVEDVAPLIADAVAKAVAEIPKPQDGKDADPPSDELWRELALEFYKANPPKDGESVSEEAVEKMVEDRIAARLESMQAKWELDFERRAHETVQRAIDRMPSPQDGKDALSLKGLSITHDDEGNVTFSLSDGEVEKSETIYFPVFKDRGVFRDGETYRCGHGVTWGGSYFIVQKDNPAGKPGESDDFRLAVKRGRDGKDAK